MYLKLSTLLFYCLTSIFLFFTNPLATNTDEAYCIEEEANYLSEETVCEDDADLSESGIRYMHNDQVKMYRVKRDGKNYGYSIWMSRKDKKVNAKYFAFKSHSQSVYNRYSYWKQNKEIVMACSGAFTTGDYSTPKGLTVDNGTIVNRRIEEDMDGLVIVYATGGIAVSDIDNANLSLGGINKKINPRKDKTTLLTWAESANATIFQTQLLVYKNEIRVTRKGRTEEAHRRFLVLAETKKGELYHIIYYVKQNAYLFDEARRVFDYLRSDKKMNVIAMINLDTGMYNIMDVKDDKGKTDYELTGDQPIKKATNLIVYHYDGD